MLVPSEMGKLPRTEFSPNMLVFGGNGNAVSGKTGQFCGAAAHAGTMGTPATCDAVKYMSGVGKARFSAMPELPPASVKYPTACGASVGRMSGLSAAGSALKVAASWFRK